MTMLALVFAALAGVALLCWIFSRSRDFGVRDLRDIAERAGTRANQPIFPAARGERGLYLGVVGAFVVGPQCLVVEERRRARLKLEGAERRLWQIRQVIRKNPNQYFEDALEAARAEITEIRVSLKTGGSSELLRFYEQALRLEQRLLDSEPRVGSIARNLNQVESLIQEISGAVPDQQSQEALGLTQIAAQVGQWAELCRSFSNAKHFGPIASRLKETVQVLTECAAHLKGSAGNGDNAADASVNSDPYAVLGIASGATASEIKAAYRKKAAAYHPDKIEEKVKAISDHPEVQAGLREWFTREMGRINAAYAELKRQGAVT